MKITCKFISLLTALSVFMCLFVFSVSAEAKKIRTGDINEDGEVKASDARLALRYAVNLEIYSKAKLKIADIDRSGSLTSSDARSILRNAAGLEEFQNEFAEVLPEDYDELINKPEHDPFFDWVVPPMPSEEGEKGTFRFTVYGNGHGVGMSQHGAVELDRHGASYEEILTHYYTGVRLLDFKDIPEKTYYAPLGEVNTYELVARIVKIEIYGITDGGKRKEALKAQAISVFTLLAYHNFHIEDKWSVGIASSDEYEKLPEELKKACEEVKGKYLASYTSEKPVQSVYSALSAGRSSSAGGIWGYSNPVLQGVDSQWDLRNKNLVSERVFTVDEIKKAVSDYAAKTKKEIKLPDDPAQWLEIISHDSAVDDKRGYVTKIRVGDITMSGETFRHSVLDMKSPCFYITYTPPEEIKNGQTEN